MYLYLMPITLAILQLPFTLIPWIMRRKSFLIDEGKYELRVLRGYSQVNAFSIRGLTKGYIFLSDALLSLDKSNLDAVIAHERGHLEMKHHIKMELIIGIPITLSLYLLMNGMTWFAIPLLVSTVILQRYVSRRFELEADRYALRTVSPHDLASLISSYGEKRSNFLSTHPDMLTRLKNLGYS